jgi:hypothetical protein
MPLRSLDEELARERRRDVPELRNKRNRHVRTDDDLQIRADARASVREDAREDSRSSLTGS